MSKYKIAEGKCIWAKVFEPDTKFNPDGVYSVDLLKPETEAVKMSEYLEGLVQERMAEEIKASPKYKDSLSTHLPYEKDFDRDGNETGNIKFKFKLDAKVKGRNGEFTQKPAVMDAKRTPMSGENLIGNGSDIKVAFEPRTYFIPASKTVGVKLHLRGVQVINLVSYGDSASMFEDEDGYTETAVEKDDRQDTPFDTASETVDAEGDF